MHGDVWLDGIVEAFDAHLGDPTGGRAYRLIEDVAGYVLTQRAAEPEALRAAAGEFIRGGSWGTQTTIARMLGVSDGQLSSFLRGKGYLGKGKRQRLAEIVERRVEDNEQPPS